MTRNFRLTVLTPERALLSVDEVIKVRLRLVDEVWISIYPRHAPLIAETRAGTLQYDTDAASGEIDVAAGILRVGDGEILVLTSGLRRDRGQPEPTETAAEMRFDRLAAQLMQSLAAQADTGAGDAAGGEP